MKVVRLGWICKKRNAKSNKHINPKKSDEVSLNKVCNDKTNRYEQIDNSQVPSSAVCRKAKTNAKIMKEISCSVVVETLDPSSVSKVISQLVALGYDNILIRGLSFHKFLLTFMK